MTPASDLRSGKTDRDENFPVASWIIHPRHRALILAFYNFVRTADDIADHALLDAPAKLALLDELEAGLLGRGDEQAEAVILREALETRGMPPRHALDVLTAFRMDVTKLRYADWDELIHYCSFSAMPVGRFMLDVHGESKATWPASDALCAALQINNHLQDCGNDYRDLDRVYIPQDVLDRHGATVDDLKQSKASPALLACIRELVARTETLMHESETLTVHIADVRLGCDVAVIETFAWQILKMLKTRDPLSEKVHLSKASMAGYALAGIAGGLWRPRHDERAAASFDDARRMNQMTSEAENSGAQTEVQGVAAGSSFYAAMRILPRAQRDAMFQIYSFCRQVDDIADSFGPRDQRLADMQQWRADIHALYAGNPPARVRDYVGPIKQFGMRKEDFIAVIDGMEMDIPADIRAPDEATLDLYCDRVASAVGRLSVKVFGLPDDDGILLAHHLGRALQLTNILRDLDEDAGIGRLYLPRELLYHAGITSSDPNVVIASPALPKVCAPLVKRAQAHFAKSDEIMARNKRRNVRAPRIMSKYYHAILELLVARGFALPRDPVRLGKASKIAILLLYAII